MGLGPRNSSLLKRLNTIPPIWSNPFAMQMEQQQRGEARREKAIWHAQRHSHPKRPLAPVTALPKAKGYDRVWQWDGEDIPSKGLVKDSTYTAKQLRKAGFKLPVIPKADRKIRA
jgi:hypothetical protein